MNINDVHVFIVVDSPEPVSLDNGLISNGGMGSPRSSLKMKKLMAAAAKKKKTGTTK